MSSSEASCSDCKIELIQKKWTKLLLKWLNRCIYVKGNIRDLSPKCLSDIMSKYKKDICENDFDRAMLCTDDMESFIKYKYPLLRLRYLSDEKDVPKKLYIMASILLFHCCVSSRSGVVVEDICEQLNNDEQELVLKFCERLNEMETTIYNVEQAVRDAFESMIKLNEISSPRISHNEVRDARSSDTLAQMSSLSTMKSSMATLRSDSTIVGTDTMRSLKVPILKFTSSITVLPSVVTETSTYSDGTIDSDDHVIKKKLIRHNNSDDNICTGESKDKSKREKKNLDDFKKESDGKRVNNYYNVSREHTDSNDNFVKEKQIEKETGCSRKASVIIKNRDNTEATQSHVIGSRLKPYQPTSTDSKKPCCLLECSCTRCSLTGPCCGDPGSTMGTRECNEHKLIDVQKLDSSKFAKFRESRKISIVLVAVVSLLILIVAVSALLPWFKKDTKLTGKETTKLHNDGKISSIQDQDAWQCKNNLCQKIYRPTNANTYQSYSRCSLICTRPQIWPLPIGHMEFSKNLISLATNKLQYKLETVPSDTLRQHLAETFKLFIGDLAKLERTGTRMKDTSLDVKKMSIHVQVDADPDPRLRLNTEEAYQVALETIENEVLIKISSSSFCGVRHGLETLSQIILLDESTGYLITTSYASIKDAPSYKYRGLMIDTGRNFIPVADLMRTIDGMATVKLNTFHWRISDVTSFPLHLPKLPQLVEYGAYDRNMIYTKEDVKTVVKRAAVRGIRVLMEVAVPGPVGRPWSWNTATYCPSKINETCDNMLCLRLDIQDSVLNDLQIVYEEILEMTNTDDIFHLSYGVFSLANCYNLMNNRVGFLDKALERLKLANKGFLPNLPIVWYTSQLSKHFESKTWERFGVQLNEWMQSPSDQFLSKFKVIHSSKWDLSCEMKNQRCRNYRTWQEMYSWKSWRNIGAFTVEGGEAVLWTDLVNSGNLDYHLWPRTAAVAERLWSDIVVNASADGSVYLRLNNHRTRMLLIGVTVQPIWPEWCTFNPEPCLKNIY